ncbi:heme-degrading domain-containing protein [Mesorhizobium sp. YR577]|uniref:heme-degrading domain-containing protein n=1 Tax=Mesorhizobium sp. YR577 TaxID=1884373 RepID=UPI0008F0FC03|nr:heme-degrading domain-containing protein [Mesorhizobium sp. YR577]SFU17069.1 Uncharacterized protein, UPF0303 family [Mesorhizobium sp. YR577]
MTETALDLAGLLEEQKTLELSSFDYDLAWELGSRIRQRAQSEGLPVAIEIRHGNDIVFATLARGATIDNFDWVRRKCAVVHRFHRSSLAVRVEAEHQGYDFNARFRLPVGDYAASGGGVPLILKGAFVGSVGVSGLPHLDDHKLAVDCIKEMIQRHA